MVRSESDRTPLAIDIFLTFDLGKFSDFVKQFRVNIFIILGLWALFRTEHIRNGVKSEGTIKRNISTFDETTEIYVYNSYIMFAY